MHYWPQPLTSLNALAPIFHLVVPFPVPAVSTARPRPSAPPLAGPRSVRRVDLTGALDVSSPSPIVVPLRDYLRLRADSPSLRRRLLIYAFLSPGPFCSFVRPHFTLPGLSSHLEIDFTG